MRGARLERGEAGMTGGHARIAVGGESAELLERAAAEAFEAGALGTEEREGPLPALWVYARAADAARVHAALSQVTGLALAAPEPVPERAWSEAWKEGLEPIVVSPRLLVRPPFRRAPAGFAGAELVIEPGQAFGTGAHASTRLALEAIDALPAAALRGARALDVGCGSGVLALAALALGAGSALACDVDPLATAATRATARAHGLAGRLAVYTGSLDALASDARFGVAVANLLRRELEPLLPALARVLAPGASAVLSGLLASERTPLEAALAALGLTVRSARTAPEPGGDAWLALVLARA
jgi:ribosomal protein L11 methyltransferase